jgi:DNA-binding transcriptional MerR regulator
VAKQIENTPKLYSISQVHALTGVPKPTLRFWEKEFKDFIEPLRTSGNQRRYNETNVERIQKINHLVKVEGYTLEGARKKLEALEQSK